MPEDVFVKVRYKGELLWVRLVPAILRGVIHSEPVATEMHGMKRGEPVALFTYEILDLQVGETE